MTSRNPLSIGLIGLDTSHVSAFARILNDPGCPEHLPGARVTCAWPGGSPDFALSADRVAGFTRELREERGVEILDSPEEVARRSELVFITAVDGRSHPELMERVAPIGKPVFVDKPFALSVAEARRMLEIAERRGIALMSCSALRFAGELVKALAAGRERVTGAQFFGPMPEVAMQPGLFWYGCHSAEMLVATMGPGAAGVSCARTPSQDLLRVSYPDGRIASIHGLRDNHGKFGGVLHFPDGPRFIDASTGRPFYLGLLEAILESLPHGRSAVPADEMLEVVGILSVANLSRERGGVELPVER